MSSVTARGRFHEPALLLDEARTRSRGARGDGVIRVAAEQGDRPLWIETAELVASDPFQPRPGLLPDLHPPPRRCDLLVGPVGEAIVRHHPIIDGPYRRT